MGSKFLRWFNKYLQKTSNRIDSTNIWETDCEFPVGSQENDSVTHSLNMQQNVENEAVEEQFITASKGGFDLGHSQHTSTGKFVSADESSRNMNYNETTQALTTKLEISTISNSYACASVNCDVYSDTLFSNPSTLLCTNSDLPVKPSVYSGLTADQIALIENDVQVHLNRMCPTIYYDFCLITCDVDYEEATIFRSEFCRKYNLTGCMLFDDDIASLGEDIFEQYEAMMKRSTKVFFYHTENYKKDSVLRRVQNGAVYQQLWEQMCRDKDKCVPIFPNGHHRLGLALSGISGLDPTHPEHMHRRVQATFTDKIRAVRVLKEADAKKRRHVLYKELCEYMAHCFKERKCKGLSMKSQLALNMEGMKKQELEISTFSDIEVPHLKQMLTSLSIEEEAMNRISMLVSESNESSLAYDGMHTLSIQPAQNNSSSGISISESSNIHVGPHIEVNVHVSRTGERDSHLSTGSDDI